MADGRPGRRNNSQVRRIVAWIVALGLLGLAITAWWYVPGLVVDDVKGKPVMQGPGLLTTTDYIKAVSEERRTVLAGIVAIGAALGLFVKFRGHELDRDSNRTDRFNSALTNLNSPSPAVRLGAIYSLERVGKDSRRDAATVVEILSALLRAGTRPDIGRKAWPKPERQAVMDVLLRNPDWRIAPKNKTAGPQRLHLYQADLSGLNLKDANLADAILWETDFSNANLTGADLRYANAEEADFSDAELGGVKWEGANTDRATFTDLPGNYPLDVD